MIIAVDFDGTLFDGKIVNTALIKKLKQSQNKGDCVILWTCREGKRLVEALNILINYGFRPTLVNQNSPQMIKKIGYDPRKIIADVYIDDKAITVN